MLLDYQFHEINFAKISGFVWDVCEYACVSTPRILIISEVRCTYVWLSKPLFGSYVAIRYRVVVRSSQLVSQASLSTICNHNLSVRPV